MGTKVGGYLSRVWLISLRLLSSCLTEKLEFLLFPFLIRMSECGYFSIAESHIHETITSLQCWIGPGTESTQTKFWLGESYHASLSLHDQCKEQCESCLIDRYCRLNACKLEVHMVLRQ